jgi:hypothetical protein
MAWRSTQFSEVISHVSWDSSVEVEHPLCFHVIYDLQIHLSNYYKSNNLPFLADDTSQTAAA